MMSSDRVWFHIIQGTYGSWLPGDPRGFRTRHHRRHVEGDYKSPPPQGLFDPLHRHHQQSLSQAAVTLTEDERAIVGAAVRDQLVRHGGRVLAMACGGQHLHVQTQLDAGDARIPMGYAKRHATFVIHLAGRVGKLWALRPKIIRIRDESHQRNVYRYILEHRAEGAWVWSELEHS